MCYFFNERNKREESTITRENETTEEKLEAKKQLFF